MDDQEYSEQEKAAMAGELDTEMDEADDNVRWNAVPAPEVPDDFDESATIADLVSDEQGAQLDEGKTAEQEPSTRTFSQEEYDKVVRQRDAVIGEKQDLTKSQRRVTDRLDQIAKAMETQKSLEKEAEEVDPDDLSQADRIERQQTAIIKRLDKLDTRGLKRDDERDAANAAAEIQKFAGASQKAHLEEIGGDDHEFLGRLQAVRKDFFEDQIDNGLTEDEAWIKLNRWEIDLITRHAKKGTNPAKAFDARFKRKGLEPHYADEADQEGAEENSSGDEATSGEAKSKARVKAKSKAATEKANIKRAARGQKVGSPGGSRRTGQGSMKLTYAVLDKMDPEDFDKVMAKIKGTKKEDELDSHGSTYLPL